MGGQKMRFTGMLKMTLIRSLRFGDLHDQCMLPGLFQIVKPQQQKINDKIINK